MDRLALTPSSTWSISNGHGGKIAASSLVTKWAVHFSAPHMGCWLCVRPHGLVLHQFTLHIWASTHAHLSGLVLSSFWRNTCPTKPLSALHLGSSRCMDFSFHIACFGPSSHAWIHLPCHPQSHLASLMQSPIWSHAIASHAPHFHTWVLTSMHGSISRCMNFIWHCHATCPTNSRDHHSAPHLCPLSSRVNFH